MSADDLDKSLLALVAELKNPLINIARLAELSDDDSRSLILATAEESLSLIDSYILSAQSEYGQTSLALSPTSIGSVLYEASGLLRQTAKQHNTELVIDDRTQDLVMTNRKALMAAIMVFGKTIISSPGERSYREIILRGYKTSSGRLGVGLFSDMKITQADLNTALSLKGAAHMTLPNFNTSNNISISIAESLCRAVGGKLHIKHMGKLSGFSTELPPSEQLAFV